LVKKKKKNNIAAVDYIDNVEPKSDDEILDIEEMEAGTKEVRFSEDDTLDLMLTNCDYAFVTNYENAA
jgi:hypothetical protein